MKTKLFCMLLAVCLISTMVFACAITVSATNFKGWTVLSDGQTALEHQGRYYLNKNITGGVIVNSNDNATLDLNGYTITCPSNSRNNAVEVLGRLTIEDSSADKTGTITIEKGAKMRVVYVYKAKYSWDGQLTINGGTITGGNIDENMDARRGAGLCALAGARVTMNGGKITGNTGTSGVLGGGVWVNTDATFILNGGEISNNTAGDGGNIYLGNDYMTDSEIKKHSATFIMNGGTITGGTTLFGDGAGIYCRPYTNISLLGGTITKNNTDANTYCTVGGVFFNNSDTGSSLVLGGDINITGNTIKGTTERDINLCRGSKITISTEKPLSENAKIGVFKGENVLTLTGAISTELSADYQKNFVSNFSGYNVYDVVSNNNHKLCLYKDVTSVAIKESTSLDFGESETLSASVAPSDASDKSLSWSSDNTSVATVNNGVVTAVGVGTANITAEALYGKNVKDTCAVTVSAVPTFTNSFDSGFYTDKNDKTFKEGLIAFTSKFDNISAYNGYSFDSANDKYGIALFKVQDKAEGSRLETSVSKGDFTSLKNENGYFYAFVKEVPEANFGTNVYAMPFVILGGKTYWGNLMYTSVNAGGPKNLGDISTAPQD